MTTDQSRRRVKLAAVTGTVIVGAGAAVAIGANPFPAADRPKDADVLALEAREQTLARDARRVNAINAERWASYRTDLAARKRQIAQVNAANDRVRAAIAARGQSPSPSYSGGSSASGSASTAAPAATYVPPAAPVARSSSS
jgi:hypothetical protein